MGGQPSVYRSRNLGIYTGPKKPGEIVPEVGTPADPDESIRTTDRCVVHHRSEAKDCLLYTSDAADE